MPLLVLCSGNHKAHYVGVTAGISITFQGNSGSNCLGVLEPILYVPATEQLRIVTEQNPSKFIVFC